MRFFACDGYTNWGWSAVAAGSVRGHDCRVIMHPHEIGDGGYGFVRLPMHPKPLARGRQMYAAMADRLTMIQDATQIAVYENKSEQFRRWPDWMPETWRFTDADAAVEFAHRCDLPIVSKADTGASSVNVRIIHDRGRLLSHVRQVLGEGVRTGRGQRQAGYLLLQRCIPHAITYRVNAIGDARAVFLRYCHPDRMVAQTGNVEPAFELSDELESLLEYSDRFFAHAGTKWCAIDVLKDGDKWLLLETSEGWPWPSPGRCNDGTIFRSKGRKWGEMFEAMFDEIELGAWSDSSVPAVSFSTST